MTGTFDPTPAQDFSLMLRVHALRSARDRLLSLADTLQTFSAPDGWSGPAAAAFVDAVRSGSPGLRARSSDLETAENRVAAWRHGL